ncbi:AGAP008044-PA-like protein [Anopheles sinensis]|uniref:AGAP008044-PA-like protein n=1 Tax=Anopheles sinensis TaxID=74873 RepID=A0A084VND9_ANOSI|nr:AGAP008044-PA-like protein [Anopheles sinensis]
MLSVSRVAIGNFRKVHTTVVRKHVLAGGCSQTLVGRRWFSRKVKYALMVKESGSRRRYAARAKEDTVESCDCPDEENVQELNSSVKNQIPTFSTSDNRRRIPMMGELIQFPNDSNPYPAPPKPRVLISSFSKETAHKSVATQGGPSCPPPPPPPPGQSYTGYLLGAIALTAGGLGLAYYNGLFDSTPPPTPVDDTKEKPSPQKGPYPLSSKDLPKHVPYLLIGGGTACIAAFRSIRGHDPKAKVLMITNELEMPYMRPPLSKELWFSPSESEPLKFRQWNGGERSIFFEPNDYYIDPAKLSDAPNGGIAVARGYEVQRLDVTKRKAILTDGTEIEYDKCLLAPGARPKNLPVFESAPLAVREKVTLFRSVRDFQRLTEKLGDGHKVAIIGGGFLGSELACALSKSEQTSKKNIEVFQLFNESGNMAKVLPEYLSHWTTERLREEGIKMWPKTQVKAAEMQGKQVKLTLLDDSVLLVDHVIVAVGSEPNTNLAKTSGLEVDGNMGGFVVDAELRARSNVYVAGDAACFYDTKFGRRRLEHHDHAIVTGRLAGENMVGLNKPYTQQSMFWSDLGPKISFEAVGLVDSALPTRAVFAIRSVEDLTRAVAGATIGNDSAKLQAANANGEIKSVTPAEGGSKSEGADNNRTQEVSEKEEDGFNKGVVFYLRENKVVGVLMWNVFNKLGIARKIVDQCTEWDDLNEVAKLFHLHGPPAEEDDKD